MRKARYIAKFARNVTGRGRMNNLSLISILASALTGFVVGGLWYGPLFGRLWARANRLSEDDLRRRNMLKVFGLAFAFSLLSALFLGHLLAFFDTRPRATMMISTGIALGFVVPALGTLNLFERRGATLFFIHAGYWIVTYALMGLVFTWLR